ncbi:MAG: DUF3237 domain-containing protein [Actinobacteria bacterium]|nr:DUF3237 domain-containing protein [Actinomycetota bacterium]
MELQPFGTLTIETDPEGLFVLGTTSAGRRIIQEFRSVRLDGGRVRGTMIGKSGADWLAIDADNNVTIDIKVLLETDDGARVFVTLDGRAYWPQLGAGPIYSTVRFESGDERYQWVNRLRLVSKGNVTEGRAVAHEIFELG